MALPAVMTLHSGAAQAVTSITCGDKGIAAGATALHLIIPPTPDDGFMRSQVQLYDQMVPGTDMYGNPTTLPSNVPTYYSGIKNGQPIWRLVTDGTELPGQPSDLNQQPNLPQPFGFAVVHISADDGSIAAVGSPYNPSNSIVTSAAGACMASLGLA